MIQGNRVVLRTVREQDLDVLYGLLSDVASRGEHFPVRLTSEAGFKKEFRETGFWTDHDSQVLICTPEGAIVGTLWFFKTAPYLDGLEIGGQIFDVRSHGKGYMSEALAMLVDFLFATTKVNRVQAAVVVGNAASRRLTEKCGFRSEGILRGAVYLRGENHDVEMFAILRSEASSRTTA